MFAMETPQVELQHIKRVSRIKHEILTKYLPSWARILGSAFDLLYYVDCFAGPGRYEFEGGTVDGSPIIATKAGKEFATANPGKKLGLVLVEDDAAQLKQLKGGLDLTLPYPANFQVVTKLADSREIIPRVIGGIKARKSPSFFLVDPYGHPLSIPMMNDILALPHSELLIQPYVVSHQYGYEERRGSARRYGTVRGRGLEATIVRAPAWVEEGRRIS